MEMESVCSKLANLKNVTWASVWDYFIEFIHREICTSIDKSLHIYLVTGRFHPFTGHEDPFFNFHLSKVIFNHKFIKLCPLITKKHTVLQLIVISNPLLSILSAIFQNYTNLKPQSYIKFCTISVTLDIQV